MLYASDILALVARSVFVPVDEIDRSGFAGIESDNALICYGEDYTLLLDGNRVCYINGDWDEQHFVLRENLFAQLL